VNVLWGGDANGVELETTQAGQPAIASDGAGGAFVAWLDLRNEPLDGDIYARRVNSSGVPQWIANGRPVCTAGSLQQNPVIIADGANGAIVCWWDYRAGLDIYAQRINDMGDRLWSAPDANTVAMCTAAGDQKNVVLVSDGSGGAILAWDDRRSDNYDVYVQRVTGMGLTGVNILGGNWLTDGVRLRTPNDVAGVDDFNPTIVADGGGGAIVAWTRGSTGTYDIYSQHVNGNGYLQWNTNGVVLSAASNVQSNRSIAADGSGGAIATWYDLRGADGDLYAQHVLAGGSLDPLWTSSGSDTNGRPVCTAASDQNNARLVTDGSGGVIAVWQDTRNGPESDIYAVRVRSNGQVTAVPPPMSQDLAPALAWPNPFKTQVSIAFSLPAAAPVRMEVLDVAGRRVWTSPTQLLGPGNHSLAWDGKGGDGSSQAGSVYFLRVMGPGIVASRPVVRMK
jgi:hypothetical protein